MKNKSECSCIVTVVMSVFNGDKYLEEAIESICSQTINNFEFIIIDDGSTDNTQKILQKYSQKYSYIKVILNKENLGQSISKNKAIKIAKGKYIASIDSDDVAFPKRLQKQVNFLEAHPDVYLVGSNTKIIDQNGFFRRKWGQKKGFVRSNDILTNKKIVFHSTIMFRNMGTSTLLYRDEIIYVQDKDLFLRILESGLKIYIMKDDLLKHRSHPGQITSEKIKEQSFFLLKVHQFYHERKKGKDTIDLLKEPEDDLLYNSEIHNFVVQNRTLFSSFKKNDISKKMIFHHLCKSTKLELKVYYPRFKFYIPIILICMPRWIVIELFKIQRKIIRN